MKLKKTSIAITISLFAVFIWSCKTAKIEPPKPKSFIGVQPPKPTSIIGLPINISTEGLSKSINKKFTTQLYKDSSFEDNGGDNLKLNVLKRGDFLVSTENNGLSMTAPLHIDFNYLLSFFGSSQQINKGINLTINFTTNPAIDRDWNLILNSKGKITWDDLPVIDLGITKLDLPQIFGSLIQNLVNKMAKKIDTEVPKSLNLKKQISDAWLTLADPILLDSTNKAWLMVNPKNVFITPITYTKTQMQIKLGLSSVVELVSGFKPVNDSFAKQLPPLRQVNNFEENIKLNLGASVSFDQINESLTKQFAGKPIELESYDYKMKINDAKAFNYGNKVMIALDIDGKVRKGIIGKNIKGVVYATGVPIYNAKNKTIEIKQFDFEIKTRDILLKAGSWLLNSVVFKQTIEKQLVYSIADQLNQARLSANDAINKKMIETVDIKGFVKNLEPGEIFVTPNSIRINIITDGNIEVNLNGF
ncbi:MAG: DUF4403 family protein [Bacteroidia bacterium]